MIIPIRCFTCGKVISDKWIPFIEKVNEKKSNERDIVELNEELHKISLMAKVSSEDIGRVIGKRGRVANSIRTLVRAAAVKDGVDVEVDFSD